MLKIANLRCGLLLASILMAGETSADELVVEATIPRSGYSMAFGFNSLWMMGDNALARVSSADNSIVDIEIPAGENGALLAPADRYRGIAIGERAVWLPDVGNSVIHKIDPQTNEATLAIPTFIVGSAGNIGVGAGAIWVVTFESHDKTLTRYNAESGAQEAQIALPRPCKGVVVDFGKVWVAAANAPELYVIDPAANAIVSTIAIHASSHLLASGSGSIWIGHDKEGVVEAVDGGLGRIISTLETGVTDMESDGDIAVGGGYVWMITRGSTIAQIDPETDSVKRILRPAVGTIMGRRIRFGDGSLWVSGSKIFRIKAPD